MEPASSRSQRSRSYSTVAMEGYRLSLLVLQNPYDMTILCDAASTEPAAFNESLSQLHFNLLEAATRVAKRLTLPPFAKVTLSSLHCDLEDSHQQYLSAMCPNNRMPSDAPYPYVRGTWQTILLGGLVASD